MYMRENFLFCVTPVDKSVNPFHLVCYEGSSLRYLIYVKLYISEVKGMLSLVDKKVLTLSKNV